MNRCFVCNLGKNRQLRPCQDCSRPVCDRCPFYEGRCLACHCRTLNVQGRAERLARWQAERKAANGR